MDGKLATEVAEAMVTESRMISKEVQANVLLNVEESQRTGQRYALAQQAGEHAAVESVWRRAMGTVSVAPSPEAMVQTLKAIEAGLRSSRPAETTPVGPAIVALPVVSMALYLLWSFLPDPPCRFDVSDACIEHPEFSSMAGHCAVDEARALLLRLGFDVDEEDDIDRLAVLMMRARADLGGADGEGDEG